MLNLRKITVNALLDAGLTPKQNINDFATVYLTDSEEHQIYIFDDITQDVNGITYTVPTNLPAGEYKLYCEIEYIKNKKFNKSFIIQ